MDKKAWLKGYEAIAKYMEVHKDTIKRYVSKYGFPIRKLPGNTVYCIPKEIDEWLINHGEVIKK